MKLRRAVLSCSLAAVCLAAAVLAGPADAARPPAKGPGGGGGSTSATGNDISYPQCGRPYPNGQAFGIVGVNGGLANNTNKCFADELAWAQRSSGATTQPKASLYVNTGNPSGAGPVWWPTSNTFYDTADGTDSNDPADGSAVTVPTPAYGPCGVSNDAGCAYVYGWAKAYEDFQHRGVPAPSSYTWWLDVETSNSWETPSSTDPGAAYTANIASLRGMIDYFTLQGGVPVGIYSTPYQWGQITGITTPDANDPFAGIPTWIAGASSSNASSFCAEGFTYGATATLVQYVSGRFDYDVACS